VRANLWRDPPFARRQVGNTQIRTSQANANSQSWGRNRAFNFKMGAGVHYRVRVRFDYDTCCWGDHLAELIISYRILCGDVSCKFDDDSVGQPVPR
jgi:hypothetical protein